MAGSCDRKVNVKADKRENANKHRIKCKDRNDNDNAYKKVFAILFSKEKQVSHSAANCASHSCPGVVSQLSRTRFA